MTSSMKLPSPSPSFCSPGPRPLQTAEKRAWIVPHRAGQQDFWRVQAGLVALADFEDIDDAQWLVDQLTSRGAAMRCPRRHH